MGAAGLQTGCGRLRGNGDAGKKNKLSREPAFLFLDGQGVGIALRELAGRREPNSAAADIPLKGAKPSSIKTGAV